MSVGVWSGDGDGDGDGDGRRAEGPSGGLAVRSVYRSLRRHVACRVRVRRPYVA